MPYSSASRMSLLRLIGWVWMQRSASMPCARTTLDLSGRGEVEKGALVAQRRDHGRMRQGLERVVQIHAGKRGLQHPVLLADALTVDDQKGRAELARQALDLAALEWIDVALARDAGRRGASFIARATVSFASKWRKGQIRRT